MPKSSFLRLSEKGIRLIWDSVSSTHRCLYTVFPLPELQQQFSCSQGYGRITVQTGLIQSMQLCHYIGEIQHRKWWSLQKNLQKGRYFLFLEWSTVQPIIWLLSLHVEKCLVKKQVFHFSYYLIICTQFTKIRVAEMFRSQDNLIY